MNFIKSAIFGRPAAESSPALEEEEQQTRDEPQVAPEDDVLNQFMPGDMQEEMFCFTAGDCELHKLVPRHQQQSKECVFMNTSVHLASM